MARVRLSLSVLLFLILATSGCIHSRVTPFSATPPPKTAVAASGVEVYRSHGDFGHFVELGIISLRLGDLDLPWIYDRFREDAGAHGAEAVLDLRVTTESHVETEPVQRCVDSSHCDAEGRCDPHENCWTDWVSRNVTTYLATGTMVRRKE